MAAEDSFYFKDHYIEVELKGSRYELAFANLPLGKDAKSLVLIMCPKRPCPRSAREQFKVLRQDDYITVGTDRNGDYIVEFGPRPDGSPARSLRTSLTLEPV